MKTLSIFLSILLSPFIILAVSDQAQAQATRTWVSGVGDDANPCSRTAPCKTFAGAISKTAAGGEISVLDPGGYGAVTITKSITINGEGTLGSIAVAGSNGIIVNAGVSDTVYLRNIDFIVRMGVSPPSGLHGIKILRAGNVILENLKINGDTENAVHVASTSPVNVSIRNLSVNKATNAAVFVENSPAQRANVTIENSNFRGNSIGIEAKNGFVVAANSNISQNSGFGVLTGGSGTVTLENIILSQNSTAIQAGTGSTIRLSNTSATDNLLGYGCGGGQILTVGDNRKAGNTGLGGSACSPTGSIAIQ